MDERNSIGQDFGMKIAPLGVFLLLRLLLPQPAFPFRIGKALLKIHLHDRLQKVKIGFLARDCLRREIARKLEEKFCLVKIKYDMSGRVGLITAEQACGPGTMGYSIAQKLDFLESHGVFNRT
jgi:hypothetical protein